MLLALEVKNSCIRLVMGHALTLVEIKDYVICSMVNLLAFSQTVDSFNLILFLFSLLNL